MSARKDTVLLYFELKTIFGNHCGRRAGKGLYKATRDFSSFSNDVINLVCWNGLAMLWLATSFSLELSYIVEHFIFVVTSSFQLTFS